MNDKELLSLAAKAAGIDIEPGYGHAGSPESEMFFQDDQGFCQSWNPLTDDGDALRLAVELDLLIMPYPFDMAIRVTRLDQPDTIEHYTGDQLAATRRAIVRAAAAIGRSMK